MKVQKINNEISFGMRDINGKHFEFKLSPETLKLISESTRLSGEELHRLPFAEAARHMKKRAPFKEKLKLWCQQLGERLGL